MCTSVVLIWIMHPYSGFTRNSYLLNSLEGKLDECYTKIHIMLIQFTLSTNLQGFNWMSMGFPSLVVFVVFLAK
jgi:hypothetical protein